MAAKYNYSMIRGDSKVLRVQCDPPFSDGDRVQMMVRESFDSDPVLSKEITDFDNGDAVIAIAHDDTKDIDPGDYVYDIQVTWAGGNVQTLIQKSRFRIEEDITHD